MTTLSPNTRFLTGTHDAAVRDRQIAGSSHVFFRVAFLPAGTGLGLGRTFAITQEEHPPWRQSSVLVNTAFLSSTSVTPPLRRTALQTWPQYPQEQSWSVTFRPGLPSAAGPASPAIRFIQSPGSPQAFQDQVWASVVFSPAQIPSAFVVVTPVILEIEEIGDGQQGKLRLRWKERPI